MASFCASCGGGLADGANFCSACGKPITNPLHPIKPFVRSRIGRKVAGICRGLADHYGWDVNITRIIAVVLAVVSFPLGPLAYCVCWVIVPEEPGLTPSAVNLKTIS